MKKFLTIIFTFACCAGFAQIDPDLLRKAPKPSDSLKLNMDAVYDRPLTKAGKLPVSIGGYVEANYQHITQDGISEGHQFQMRRLTIFMASSIAKRLKFLTEIEFEDGTKEINIEFASIDFEVSPLLNFRGGVIMNPIGSFNQNHDGPKWEFVERPLSATQMLPATWSNAGFGVFGKKYANDWVYAYELYLSNGFDERIINNTENRTFLPASKLNAERFEENFNGHLLTTAKFALRNKQFGELGISYMGGVYNKDKDDGLFLDEKRRTDIFALDFNTTLPYSRTFINGEWAWVAVDVPSTFTEQFGSRQQGGFVDIVQPVYRKPVFGFEQSVVNVSLRLEYVDWNRGSFKSTGGKISDHIYCVVPSISFRPVPQTVFRINYRRHWQTDLLGNPASKLAGWQFGISSYF